MSAVIFKSRTESMKRICETLCASGKFETGEGGCAALCMSMLGPSRPRCEHKVTVHGALASAIVSDLDNQEAA